MPARAASNTDTICPLPFSRASRARRVSSPSAGSRHRGAGHQDRFGSISNCRTQIDDRQPHQHPRCARRGPAGAVGHPTCPSPENRSQKEAADDAFSVPWQKTPSKRRREILVPDAIDAADSSADTFGNPRDPGRIDRPRAPLAQRTYRGSNGQRQKASQSERGAASAKST